MRDNKIPTWRLKDLDVVDSNTNPYIYKYINIHTIGYDLFNNSITYYPLQLFFVLVHKFYSHELARVKKLVSHFLLEDTHH